MENPKQFYLSQLDKYQLELKQVRKKLGGFSLLRLLVFLAVAFGVYYFFGNLQILLPLIIVGIAIFIVLVSRYTELKDHRDKILNIIDINQTELKVLDRDFQDLSTGKEFEDDMHPYSQDVDLFGDASFFQYLNRTSLSEGKVKLAEILLENSIENINQKQDAIQELAQKPDWRQHFSALAGMVKVKTNTQEIVEWFQQYKKFVPAVMYWIPWVFTVFSGLVFMAYYFDLLGFSQILLWIVVGMGITGIYLKKINKLAEGVDKVQDTFHQYYQLLGQIENTSFTSELLQQKKKQILSKNQKVSEILKQFSKAIDALDQRNNLIFGLIGNAFLLWDLRQSYRLEKWISSYRNEVEDWLELIAFFDAYNSLGNFVFNHPDYVLPELNQVSLVTQSKALAHPLLDPEKRVSNDFSIEKKQFYIITGANMAGKSTFLRTVSLHILMANVGLPVCAGSCSYSPIKLVTSMRTTDSLSNDESYFFSELKRLKYIVEAIKTDKYFIILDEILKGTNSTDKAIGSRKFIEKLVASQSTGIIATHDLSLCEVAEELPQVKNYYFDAEIIQDELNFDYKFKEGICKNMNASFLLRKMEIVD